MPEHEIVIRYRVPLDANTAHAHGLRTGEELISKLVREFGQVPYVRCDGASIVNNR